LYQLNVALLQKILSLTSKVDLTVNDNPTASAYRGHYASYAGIWVTTFD
jgi:purine nucleoside permease